MENYTGKICPFCKTEIKAEDTVKVCPVCGIPHHERCWEENKGCTTSGCSEQHYEEQHTNPTAVCSNCATPLDDGQEFCPKCGTPKNAPQKNVCGKCGAELQDGQAFCAKCGQKVGLVVDAGVNSATDQFNDGLQKRSKKKVVLPIILAVVAVVAVALVIILKKPSVEEIVLSRSSVELKAGDSVSVSYTITPDKAGDTEVTWESSNKSVAIVNSSGKITGKGDGSCTVTVTADGKTDSLTVTVKTGPDFTAIYNEYCSSDYATLGTDGSYLSIDTNPYDIDDYTVSGSITAILAVNSALGLPDYIVDDMSNTTALMGRQSETFSDLGITVSWSYHPNKGLEVTYKAIN
ncbi:zinc-ribbon domain-containing protein [Hominifimenecus sp. rT4P-3]|uniref:zinc-ribbon domain-containing protein n=1 Tax=Hominifimenecus sp. rT4P-3 TaxID=3242979 RepID=UPI003DA357B1